MNNKTFLEEKEKLKEINNKVLEEEKLIEEEYSYDGKEMSVMSAKMIWSEDTEPVLTYISLSKIKEWAYTENGNSTICICFI